MKCEALFWRFDLTVLHLKQERVHQRLDRWLPHSLLACRDSAILLLGGLQNIAEAFRKETQKDMSAYKILILSYIPSLHRADGLSMSACQNPLVYRLPIKSSRCSSLHTIIETSSNPIPLLMATSSKSASVTELDATSKAASKVYCQHVSTFVASKLSVDCLMIGMRTIMSIK